MPKPKAGKMPNCGKTKPQPQDNCEPKQTEPAPEKQGPAQQRWHQQAETAIVARYAPRFDNPSNNCWMNSILQLIVHAIEIRGEPIQPLNVPIREHFQRYGNTIYAEILRYQPSRQYSVNSPSNSDDPPTSYKQIMLFSMGLAEQDQLHAQHDAADCVDTLMRITSQLSFLWHTQDKIFQCENCTVSAVYSNPEPLARVSISKYKDNNSIDAVEAIKNYFEETQRGIDRDCPNCHGKKSTESTRLPTPSKFIIIQLLRFETINHRAQKITAETRPFSSVEIYSAQGLCTYEVVGVVEHIGRSMNGGHYVAYVKKNNQWLRCDDERIIALNTNTNDPTRNAYLVVLQTSEVDD